ncbi:MAG: hypothetical protein ACYT04_79745, partial [Nostoc sp.]
SLYHLGGCSIFEARGVFLPVEKTCRPAIRIHVNELLCMTAKSWNNDFHPFDQALHFVVELQRVP